MGSRRSAADFHEIVTALAGNRLLDDMMQGIRSRMRWALSQHDDLADVTEEHLALFEAVRARDGDRAAELATAHVESSRRRRAALAARRGTV